MKTILIFSVLLSFAGYLSGQEVKIPENYQLDKSEDYAAYKDSIVMVANWMINTPLNQEILTRASANKFVLRWITGAPDTHIEIKPEFTSDILKDKTNTYVQDLLMNYIAGMTLAKIEDDNADEVTTQAAGVNAMLNGYKSIRSEYKNKFLDKLIKLDKKGELSSWVKENNIKYDEKDKTKIVPNN